jgi:hypothetical protein
MGAGHDEHQDGLTDDVVQHRELDIWAVPDAAAIDIEYLCQPLRVVVVIRVLRLLDKHLLFERIGMRHLRSLPIQLA